jgi:hypothetical protein
MEKHAVDMLASVRPTVRTLYTRKFKFRRVYRVFKVGAFDVHTSIASNPPGPAEEGF